MIDLLAEQAYEPGGETGPRDWKKRLREAGVSEEVVAFFGKARAALREESKAGANPRIEYRVARAKENGEEVERAIYCLTFSKPDAYEVDIEGDGASVDVKAGVTHEFDRPRDEDEAADVLASFNQNMERCKRWLEEALAEREER